MSNAAPAPPLPEASIRCRPEDFVVDEIAAYEPEGAGNHLFVRFRKTGITTPEAVRRLCARLGADPAEAGYAGLKDRHAVTTQTASFLVRGDGDQPRVGLGSTADGIEVLDARRHRHKLKPGHLHGNRFTLTLREVGEPAAVEAAFEVVCRRGVPNAYGEQRFGRDRDNAARALRWIAGQERPPRSKQDRRLLFSALQSHMFNLVLEARVAAGTWDTVLSGDLAKKHDTGGMFEVGPDDLAEAEERARAGALSATGPMFGAKMRWPSGEPAALERSVLAATMDEDKLQALAKLGAGTRRPLRMWVDEASATRGPEPDTLVVSFVLPKGGYATTVLAHICRPRAASTPETC